MNNTIAFILNFESADPEEIRARIRRYCHSVGIIPQGLNVKPYWKITGQNQAAFQAETTADTNEKLVFLILKWAHVLSDDIPGDWTVIGPFDEGPLHFECIFNRREGENPLIWAHLMVV